MAREERFKITDGPSKFDFMVSLFKDLRTKLTIEFPTGKIKLRSSVDGVRSEGGSREKWFVQGIFLCHIDFTDPEILVWPFTEKFVAFNGYFDTRTRTGWVEIKKNIVRSDV